MTRIKYMHLKLSDLPNSVVQHYNIEAKFARGGYVYVEIQRELYGLLQAVLITQQLQEKRLNKKGYKKSDITPVFWTHDWRPIFFVLWFDDFGVKYVGKNTQVT